MSRRQKRLARLRQNPNNVSLDDLWTILEEYGFEHKHTVGSHHTFVVIINAISYVLVVPFHRPLKQIYVKKALHLIDVIVAASGDDDESEAEDA